MSSLVGPAQAQTTYSFGASAAGTYDWAAGANWSASAPVGGAGTTLNYSGSPAMASGAAIVSNNNITGNFLLNRLSFATAGTTTAGTLTLQGSQLEFVNSVGTAPTLNVNMGSTPPVLTINNNILLTNNLSVNVNNAFTIGGVISGGGDFIKANTSTANLSLTGANTYTGATTLGVVGSSTTSNTTTLGGANGAITASSGIGIHGSGSRLILDNSTNANSNRIANGIDVTLGTGGDLNLVGNGATSSVTENIGNLTLGAGNNVVTVSGAAAGQLVTLNASGVTRSGSSTALIRGTSLGQLGSNAGRVTLGSTAGLTFVGTTTTSTGLATGTDKNVRIIPYLLGETSPTGTGVAATAGFLTYDTLSGLRVLGTNEYTTLTAGFNSSSSVGHNVKSFNGTLSNANQTVNSLLVLGAHALNGSGTLTVNSGAVATNNAASNTAAAIGSGFSSLVLGNGEGIMNVNGYLNVNTPINVTSSGGLVKGGTGTLVLNAANLYTGGTVVNAGTVQLGNGTLNGNLGNGTATVQPQGTIILNLTDGGTISNAIVLNGAGNVTRAASTTNINSLSGGISGTGGITLNVAGSTLGLSGTQSTNTGGTNVNLGTLRVTGNVLSANSALAFSPTSAINIPVLQLRADDTTTFQAASVTYNMPTAASGDRTITIDVDQATSGNTNKTLTLDGTFTVKGYQNNVANLNITGASGYGLAIGQLVGSSHDSGGGTIKLNVSAPGGLSISSLNFTSGATTFEFNGSANTVITGDLIRTAPQPAFTLTQSGSGELTLQGAASTLTATNQGGYVFNLSGGKLNVNNAAALGDGNAVTDAVYSRTINLSGGTLDNTSGSAIVVSNNRAVVGTTNAFITHINGNFNFGGTNALQLNVGTGTGSGAGIAQRGFITLGTTAAGGGARTITSNGTAALTLNGAIVNGGGTSPTASSLTKAGTGTLALGQSNFYTGGTTVNAGTLEVGGDNVIAQSGLAGTRGATTTISGMNAAAVANLRIGQAVTGTGIAAGTVISGKLSTTSIAISLAPSSASTVADLAFTAGGGLGSGAVAVNGGTLLINSTGNINSVSGVTVSTGAISATIPAPPSPPHSPWPVARSPARERSMLIWA